MDVRLAGSGPAIAAVDAALADAEGAVGEAVDPVRVAPGRIAGADLAVVVGRRDDGALGDASDAALGTETTWIGVELGGIGGHAVAGVEAAVAGFAPGTGCYDCLRTRVGAADPDLEAVDPGVATARFAGATAGREALGLLAGAPTRVLSATGDGTRLGGVVEVPHAERTFLPVPGCDCDPGRDRDLPLAHEDRSLDAALERMELALDDRVGPVTSVGEIASFPAPYYLTTLSDTTGFSDGDAPDHAGGVDTDWNRAFAKALGEALERYSAAVYRTGEFHTAPPGAVEGAVHPDRFVRPDAPVEDDPIPWVPARNLATDATAFLPAELVQFPPHERRYFDPITTGLGLGSSTVEAVLSGLYEVIERDAAMLSWYSTFEPLELAVERDRFEELSRRVRSEGLTATAALLTVDVDVPVVGAAVHRDGEWPRFAAATAADLDPAAAAADALAEATQNWMELRSMGPEGAAEESTAIGRYAETPGPARRFFDGEGPVPADSVGGDADLDGRAELDALVGAVDDAGLEAYAANVTPRDVDAAGFAAVRVAVPGAQPLFVDVADPTFGDRARSVPADMGFEADLDGPPHPFP